MAGPSGLRLARFFRVGAAVHAVAMSGDGRKLLVGSEHDLRLLDSSGRTHFRWGGAPVPGRWLDNGARPFSAVALAPDLRAGLAVERTGRLHRLDFSNGHTDGRGDVSARATGLHWEPNDLYSLDFAPQRARVALGHLGPDVTLLDAAGQALWRRRPGETESGGRGWSVAFCASAAGEDATLVYAGCMFPARFAREAPYLLASLDIETGEVRQALALSHPVTALAALPAPLGVASVQMHTRRSDAKPEAGSWKARTRKPVCRIVAYSARLERVAWAHECGPDEVVTALACDATHGVLLAGTNTGHVWTLDACSGEVFHEHDLLYHSAVLALSAASDAQAVAVGLANGHVAYLAGRQ
jgi:hypothetical protein